MKLKEINIQKYGPLGPIRWELNEGIQPVYGPNESGKTLVVEALMRIFTGDAGPSKDAKRVDGPPQGFIVIEDDGKEKTITVDESLCDYLGIEPSELLNTLVVRNTDLRIEGEDQFYERVSDKLSGLWTKGIRKIEGKLKELGRLTDTLKLSNSKSSDKAKSQLRMAKELEGDIGKYLNKAEEEGVQALESQKLSIESEKSRLEKRRKILELGKLAEAYNEAKEAFEELSKIPPEKKISGIRENLGRVKSTVMKRSEYERNLDLYKNLTIVTGLGSTISFAAIILAGILSPPALIIPLLFFAGLVGSALLYFKTSSDLSAPEKEVDSITARVQRIGLKPSGKTQKERIISLGRKLDKVNTKRGKLNDHLRENIGVLKDNLEIKKKPADEEILEEASEKIEAKRGELGLDAQIPHDEKELDEIKDRLEGVGEKLEELEGSLETHNEKLEDFSDRSGELDFQAFLGEELDLKIVNLESLERLAKELDRFASEIEEDKITSETAVELFEGLESEEEEKISDLFGEDSETTEIFTEVTDGRYKTVDYDKEEEEIFVERPSGEKRYPSNELSGSRGTVDQLYLTIRMALARKILEDNAFFILDDALVFSDAERKERQREVLNKFSEMGWQTLYFTSNQNTAKELEDLSGNKIVTLEELP